MGDINRAYNRVGLAWQVDNQRQEDEYRYRVIDAEYPDAYVAVRKAFIALNMPVQAGDVDSGILIARNVAPHPLTKEEWLEVKRLEGPRLKELGGSLFRFEDNPRDFIITVRASLLPLDTGVLVILDYAMDSPKLRTYGIVPADSCPPTAVAIAAAKFWVALEEELLKGQLTPPRKRKENEVLT